MRDAGIVKTRKEGTMIYYYLDPEDNEIEKMLSLFQDIKQVMANVPDRSMND